LSGQKDRATIDFAVARSLVQSRIAARSAPSAGDEWILLDECTIERDWGWVVFYGSRRYRETGDIRFSVVGNAPFFVRQEDGATFRAGTARPVEDYIADFEAGGCLTIRCA